MVVSERTYQSIALAEPERKWELHHGRLREKPAMTIAHNRLAMDLTVALARQLDRRRFEVRLSQAPVRRSAQGYYIPDVYVVPRHPAGTALDAFEVFAAPLPLIVEIWSPSTGDYDVDQKIPEYRGRGDIEIWRLHPFQRTLTAWRPQPDGSYLEAVFRVGTIHPVALPGVEIDLDALFDLESSGVQGELP